MNQLFLRVGVHIQKFSAQWGVNQRGLTLQKVALSSSSKEGSENSEEDSLKPNASSDKIQTVESVPKWAPRRRRISLSPAERLFTALSEKENESGQLHSTVSNKGVSEHETNSDNLDSQSTTVSISSASESAKADRTEIKAGQMMEQSTTLQEKLRRRKHLSPLKRFSGMIPDNYWQETTDCTSVKKDLDELSKSDEPPHKN